MHANHIEKHALLSKALKICTIGLFYQNNYLASIFQHDEYSNVAKWANKNHGKFFFVFIYRIYARLTYLYCYRATKNTNARQACLNETLHVRVQSTLDRLNFHNLSFAFELSNEKKTKTSKLRIMEQLETTFQKIIVQEVPKQKIVRQDVLFKFKL